MGDLDKLIEQHDKYPWTQAELAEWIRGCTEDQRTYILDVLKESRENGEDVHWLACHMRNEAERIQRKKEARERANAPTWYEMLTYWNLGGIIAKTTEALNKKSVIYSGSYNHDELTAKLARHSGNSL